MNFMRTACILLFGTLLIGISCAREKRFEKIERFQLVEVATSEKLWTGIAVSGEGRIFVNYPRWFPDVRLSVAELLEDGTVWPYPDETWNSWSAGAPAEQRFICVQSVFIDSGDFLWVLDPARPYLQDIIENGPKLVKIDLSDNRVVRIYTFPSEITPQGSYLNDVRVETGKGFAYITDSGLGAIVVLDLKSGKSRRVLTEHPSVKAEEIVLSIDGREWPGKVHSDGLALDTDRGYLYYQALTGLNLYRIPTRWLRNATLTEEELGARVEPAGESGASDGIAFGRDGCVYLTSLEHNAIRRMTPDGEIEVVARDPRLKWPDSVFLTDDGSVFVTTSQIHLLDSLSEPFRILKLVPEGS
jgi:sugar lactone lactonase YvrE